MSSARAKLAKALATRYVIERELGSGAAAFVYRAHDRKHDRKVAIKVLRPELASLLGPERFLNEVRITARLNHPNIVPLYDSGEAAGLPYYVMPVIEGESLRDTLDRERQLSVSEAVSIVRAVASAITYAHDHDVVHRDIKPENILMHQGVPMIADFGIAAVIQKIGGTRLTVTGISLGTPAYMSPEQARGEQPGRASDVYSLASLLYEMLAGDPPFTGNSVQAILTKLQHEKPTPLRLLRENLPRGIDAAVERALAKVKADRYATVAEFTAALVAASAERVAPPDVVAAARVPHPTDPPAFNFPFLAELKQRRVFRVALAYGGIGFVILQGAPPIVNALGLPAEIDRLIAILVLVGFPIALAFSWAFELTPEGELRLDSRPRRATRGRLAWSWRWSVGAAVGATAMAGAIWWTPPLVGIFLDRGSLHPMRYVILPLADSAASVREDDLLGDAFARWTGIEVVHPYRAREQLTEPLADTDDEQRVARATGAARYVRVEAGQFGSRRRIVAALHDTESGDRLAEDTRTYAAPGAPPDSLFASLAAALLFRSAGFSNADVHAVRGTFSYPAAIEFLRGREAVDEWDIEAAAGHFQAALEADHGFVRSALWQAQTLNWAGRNPLGLKPLLDRLVGSIEGLTKPEQQLRNGLLHLGQRSFVAACATYDSIIESNPSDFAGWYGRGECHARDDVVVRDVGSPSRWSHRSSYHQAVRSYREAFRLLTLKSDFRSRTARRARSVLYTSANRVRTGTLAGDTAVFYARPELIADTLVFVPYRRGDLHADRTHTDTRAHSAAVEQQRRLFDNIARSWISTFPRSAHANEALALAQEAMADPSAIMTLRNARALSRDSIHRRILAAEETVLLVKFGVPDDMRHLMRARAVADSLLRSIETASTSELRGLAVAAAVTGRIQLAADLLRREERNETIEQDLPLALREAGAALLAYAAFGAPADSIAAYESVIDDLVRNRLPRDSQLQRRARHELLDQAAGLVFPHHPLRQSEDLARDTGHRLLQAQAALAAGDTTSARTTLHEMLRSRADARPGTSPATMPFDALYPEARLHLAIGDTAQAIVAMDSSLAALRWGEPDALAHVESMAALIHTMALRALVAAAHGDRAAARRWAAPVISLWGGADPQLEPVANSVRPLSRD